MIMMCITGQGHTIISSDLPSTLDGPWVELHEVQYQTPTPTNQDIACFKNPRPTFMSSGAKKIQQHSPWQQLYMKTKAFPYLQFEGSLSSFNAADHIPF